MANKGSLCSENLLFATTTIRQKPGLGEGQFAIKNKNKIQTIRNKNTTFEERNTKMHFSVAPGWFPPRSINFVLLCQRRRCSVVLPLSSSWQQTKEMLKMTIEICFGLKHEKCCHIISYTYHICVKKRWIWVQHMGGNTVAALFRAYENIFGNYKIFGPSRKFFNQFRQMGAL